jgi:hypothetical protein
LFCMAGRLDRKHCADHISSSESSTARAGQQDAAW